MQFTITKRSALLSFSLTTALIFSGWLILQTSNEATPAANQADRPDGFMIKAAYVRMDADGNPHNRIFSEKMVHYAANDVSQFTAPHVIMYGKDHEPWDITAKSGDSQSGSTEIHLHDNVKIYEAPGPNNHELTLLTPSLTIFPNLKTAQTDQAVTIIQPGTVVTSVGLRADLKKGEVDLLSQAKGIYETASN